MTRVENSFWIKNTVPHLVKWRAPYFPFLQVFSFCGVPAPSGLLTPKILLILVTLSVTFCLEQGQCEVRVLPSPTTHLEMIPDQQLRQGWMLACQSICSPFCASLLWLRLYCGRLQGLLFLPSFPNLQVLPSVASLLWDAGRHSKPPYTLENVNTIILL